MLLQMIDQPKSEKERIAEIFYVPFDQLYMFVSAKWTFKWESTEMISQKNVPFRGRT